MASPGPSPATDRRPTVRFLVHGAERSGPPIYVLRLLRSWNRHGVGFRPSVVLGRPGPLVGDFRRVATTTVARLDRRSPEQLVGRGMRAMGAASTAEATVRRATGLRIGRQRPDLTVVNGATTPTAALLRALPAGDRTVMIAHELSTGWFGNISEADRRLLLDRCRSYLAVSRAVEDLLQSLGVERSRITVVPPPVDLAERHGSGPRPPGRGQAIVVGGGGMTDWRKAPELWLQVAAEARRQAPGIPFRFVWFGGTTPSDPQGWPLRHEVDHLGLAGCVEFLGPVDDPWDVLGRCDLFVSTAREDAAPLVCAEAAGCGVPVVTFDSGGAAELARDGRCGVVIPYPRVDELAAAVVRLARDREQRADLGRNGTAFVEQHRQVDVVARQVGTWLMGALR